MYDRSNRSRTGALLVLAALVVAMLVACGRPTTTVENPPNIMSFTAAPDSVLQPDPVTVLSWDVENATSIHIDADNAPDPGAVDPDSGSIQVVLPGTTTYALTASNQAGSVTSQTTVTVKPYGIARFSHVVDNTLLPLQAAPADSTVDLVISIYVQAPAGSIVTEVVASGGGHRIELFDNGQLANGDEIIGDGTWSGRMQLTFPAGSVDFEIDIVIGSDVFTAIASLAVVATSGGQEIEDLLDNHDVVGSHLAGLASSISAEEALSSTVSFIQGSMLGVSVVTVDLELGIIVLEHESGLESIIQIKEESDGPATTTRGGFSPVPDRAGLDAGTVRGNGLQPAVPLNAQTRGDDNAAFAASYVTGQVTENEVGSRAALIWSPFAPEFSPWDETADLVDILGDTDFGFDVTVLTGSDATVASLLDLTSFGYVVFATHGAGGHWLQTAETVSGDRYELEQHLGQINIWQGWVLTAGGALELEPTYAVNSNWFAANLTGTFANTIIVNSSCNSTETNRLWDAFDDLGAGAYFGHHAVVSSRFAVEQGLEVTRLLVQDKATVGEAYKVKVDPYGSHNAQWQVRGNHDLSFTGGLLNPSFEERLAAWTTAGDGRAISQLGTALHRQAPTEGSRMAIISTGLGFTEAVGSIQQTFRMPSNASVLSFSWNYLSEEFLEYIGSMFQDEFSISIVDSDGMEHVLMYLAVDPIAGMFGAGFCQSDSEPCEAASGTLIRGWDFPEGPQHISFDQGDVWYTGWQETASLPVAQFQGEVVTLRFVAKDIGDSIFDTAVLIDNIRIE